MLVPVLSTSDVLAVVAASSQFNTIVAMAARERYLYVCSVASYIAQGTNPTASAADGSRYVPAGVSVIITGEQGIKLAAIRASGDGVASLTRLVEVG